MYNKMLFIRAMRKVHWVKSYPTVPLQYAKLKQGWQMMAGQVPWRNSTNTADDFG